MPIIEVDSNYLKGLEARIIETEERLAFFEEFKQFYVPHLGTRVRIAEDWTFDLYPEYRNDKLWDKVSDKSMYVCRKEEATVPVTFPAGTEFSVARIYIRQGNKEYDSVTFRSLKGTCGSQKHLEKSRFWAKLCDVRKMTVKILEE